jgi:hypothetical protein
MTEPPYDPEREEFTDVVPPEPAVCPKCESPDIRRFPTVPFVILSILLVVGFDWSMYGGITEVTGIGVGIVILLAILLDRWNCRDCGYGWK